MIQIVALTLQQLKVWLQSCCDGEKTDFEVSHHHLITELVVERGGEQACDGGEAVHHVECQAAVVTQHH